MVKKAGQKRKKEEKSKTQLKRPKTGPGVHLPKGTNVTKTEFKVGKIVIPKQLDQTTETGPLTKRKLGLKDLLGKLTHYSQSVRQESLEGLKELVTGQYGGNLVQENLSLMVNRLAPLTSDRERKVRRTAFSILQAILSQVEERKLEPLFSVLTAHLSCCLTHIEPAIQQDGLNLIDSLVSAVPAFIAANFSKILPDCLEQISTRKSDEKAKVGVSSNVSEKITALQWRVDVLQRVDKVLDAIINDINSKQVGQEEKNCIQLTFKENMFCNLYPEKPGNFAFSDLVSRTGDDAMLGIIDRILPLIIESWVEATTDGKKRRISFVSNEVFPLLDTVAMILDKLVTYANLVGDTADGNLMMNHLREKYFSDLYSRLLSNLPYSNSSGKCNAQNILLCRVTVNLADELDECMLDNILAMVSSKSTSSAERLKVLTSLLEKNLDVSKRQSAVDLLKEMSRNSETSSQQIGEAVGILSKLAETEPELGSWLETLPDLLLTGEDQQSDLILSTMLKFAQRRNKSLEKSLKEKLPSLLDWEEAKRKEDTSSSCNSLLSFIKQNISC